MSKPEIDEAWFPEIKRAWRRLKLAWLDYQVARRDMQHQRALRRLREAASRPTHSPTDPEKTE